jgi:hypothetical protein
MRSRGTAAAAAVAAFAALLVCASAAAARPASVLSVSVDPARVATTLGRTSTVRSTITNHGAATTEGLIAHLNVLGYDSGVYVDPEDWSSHRTRYLGPIPPGGSTTVIWRIEAVNAGRFAVYVAVLPRRPAAGAPTTGPAVELSVAKRTTIDSAGILPLALGIPALLGVLLLGLRLHRGR